MMVGPYGGLDPLRGWLEAARLWSEGARGADEVLGRAARRSGEETRAVLGASGGRPDVRS